MCRKVDERRIREALNSLRKEGKKEEKMKRSRKGMLFMAMILSSFLIFYGLYTLSVDRFAGLLFFGLGGMQYFRSLEEISR